MGGTTLGHKAPTTNPPRRVPRVLHCGITTSGREGLLAAGSEDHAREVHLRTCSSSSGCIVCKPTLTVPDVLLDRCKLLSYVLQ